MTRRSTLLRLAIRLQDVQSILNEDISVDPNNFPGLRGDTMGGPEARKKIHQKSTDPTRPVGLASAVDEDSHEDD